MSFVSGVFENPQKVTITTTPEGAPMVAIILADGRPFEILPEGWPALARVRELEQRAHEIVDAKDNYWNLDEVNAATFILTGQEVES